MGKVTGAFSCPNSDNGAMVYVTFNITRQYDGVFVEVAEIETECDCVACQDEASWEHGDHWVEAVEGMRDAREDHYN